MQQPLLTWVQASNGQVPPNAVEAGVENSGNVSYVGRAQHQGNLLPGRVLPEWKKMVAAWSGKEVNIQNYEVLVNISGVQLQWVAAKEGGVPPNAIECGMIGKGEILYCGRGKPNNATSGSFCGMVPPKSGKCYIPFAGDEISTATYEVLCVQLSQVGLFWMKDSRGKIPSGAVESGVENSNRTSYIGRIHHENGDLIPGRVLLDFCKCVIGYDGKEVGFPDYEVLVNNGLARLEWVPSSNGSVPMNAVPCGSTAKGETLYCGRGRPPNAKLGVYCGKLQPSLGRLYIPFAGDDIPVANYEVLCKRY